MTSLSKELGLFGFSCFLLLPTRLDTVIDVFGWLLPRFHEWFVNNVPVWHHLRFRAVPLKFSTDSVPVSEGFFLTNFYLVTPLESIASTE